MNHHHKHIPVLLNDTLRLLNPQPGESYLDLTAGYGGHARAVLEKTHAPVNAVLVDRDNAAIEALADLKSLGVKLIHGDFLKVATQELKNQMFDMILLDLGVSSVHFDTSERGFSFKSEGPLDMRMDQRQELRAVDIVNRWPETELVRILREYGEEKRAKQAAKAIAIHRPLSTTSQLAEVVAAAVGHTRGKHPATRTFQALRLAVNDELGQLKGVLEVLPERLSPDGRLVIISFHSLEDRLVKQSFKELSGSRYDAEFQSLTASPVLGQTNDVHNPRARSAKLRAVVKIKRKGQ